jgi:hypothetical protein
MKCPKCRYTSFPHLENCPKCGFGLAEQRVALGIYALRPDPPDLLLAYQATSADVTAGTPAHPVSAPGIGLGQLGAADLEIAAAEPDDAGPPEMEEPTNAAPDSLVTLEREAVEEEEFPPAEPSSEPLSTQELIMSPSLDLSGLGDISLVLESAADQGGEIPDSAQTPRESAEVKRVYDLDLDGDLEGLTLRRLADEARADDDDEAAAEYTLEIEEDLEFEVEGLEVDQDDEDEDEDDC